MLEKYTEALIRLPQKDKYEKSDLLIPTFKLDSEKSLDIYYAPHNEIVNLEAKIFIVGITPGWNQMNRAYQTARTGLIEHWDYELIKRECKKAARFAGSMRNNLIDMLDQLQLQKALAIPSCAQLFSDCDDLLHTTSLVPYPVFNKGKNYTGTHPSILDSALLTQYVQTYFYKEVQLFSDILIIPLGRAVEEVMLKMIQEGYLTPQQCLLGFPHPSGANGHRQKQFLQEKKQLGAKIKSFFNNSPDTL